MPLYEYQCSRCSQVQERVEAYVNRLAPPFCCEQPTRKLFSTSTLTFYGAGAYLTEYGSQFRNRQGRKFRQQHEGVSAAETVRPAHVREAQKE